MALNSGVLRRSKLSVIESAADDLPASSALPLMTQPVGRNLLFDRANKRR
jgi:hypothetical protein